MGSAQASKNKEGLQKLKITHILNVAGKQHFPADFVYERCFFEDNVNADMISKLNVVYEFLENAEKSKGTNFDIITDIF